MCFSKISKSHVFPDSEFQFPCTVGTLLTIRTLGLILTKCQKVLKTVTGCPRFFRNENNTFIRLCKALQMEKRI